MRWDSIPSRATWKQTGRQAHDNDAALAVTIMCTVPTTSGTLLTISVCTSHRAGPSLASWALVRNTAGRA